MSAADHGPASDDARRSGLRPPSYEHIRRALVLFAVYLAFYGVYVLLSAFAPQVLDHTLGGINLAVWYGFALILVAFALALVYGYLCRDSNRSDEDRGR